MDWYYYQGANEAPKHEVRHERYDTPFIQSVTSEPNGGAGGYGLENADAGGEEQIFKFFISKNTG